MGPLNPSGYSLDSRVGCTHVCSSTPLRPDSLSALFVLFLCASFVLFFVFFSCLSFFSLLFFSLSFESSASVVVVARGRLRPPAPCEGKVGLIYISCWGCDIGTRAQRRHTSCTHNITGVSIAQNENLNTNVQHINLLSI